MLNKCLCVVDNMTSDIDRNNNKALILIYIVAIVIILFSIYLYSTSVVFNCLCYLWCSKIIIIKSANVYDVKKNTCCKCCYKGHKPCKSVCEALRKCCNILIFDRFSLNSILKLINSLLLSILLSMRKLLSLYCLSVKRNTLKW